MPLKDPAKRREHHRKYLKKRYNEDSEYKKKHIANVKSRRIRRRKELNDIVDRWKIKCKYCNESTRCCLDAHHLDPSLKKYAICKSASGGAISDETMINELNKCICVCKNCHAKIHAGIIDDT